jgi:hypothetical protein
MEGARPDVPDGVAHACTDNKPDHAVNDKGESTRAWQD